MAKNGKRHIANKEGINPELALDLKEAVTLIKSKANSKFDETIEVALNLNIDPSQSDQTVRGVINLPNGIGKDVKWLFLREVIQLRRQKALVQI